MKATESGDQTYTKFSLTFKPYPLFHEILVEIVCGYEVNFFRLNFIDDKNLVFFMFVSIEILIIYIVYAPIMSRTPY